MLKGICRLSVIPVRLEPKDQSEMVSQLLFGEFYEVLETANQGNWLKIRNYFDHYEGWIDRKQFTSISDSFFEQLQGLEFKITTDLVSVLNFNGKKISLLAGSILPFFEHEMFPNDISNHFTGNSKSIGIKLSYDDIETISLQYLHAPYLWGGKTPFGIDCSGFMQVLFKISGYGLKRDAWQQQAQGIAISGITEAKPGDLAFFARDNGKIYHVGMLMNEEKIIHASGKVRIDKLDNKGIFIEEEQKYSHYLHSIRRIVKS